MLPGMPSKKVVKSVSRATRSRPRTVRLTIEDERWVSAQPHPHGFTGVVSDAIRFYREHKDAVRRQLLEAV